MLMCSKIPQLLLSSLHTVEVSAAHAKHENKVQDKTQDALTSHTHTLNTCPRTQQTDEVIGRLRL
jgi:hypothetical protein